MTFSSLTTSLLRPSSRRAALPDGSALPDLSRDCFASLERDATHGVGRGPDRADTLRPLHQAF